MPAPAVPTLAELKEWLGLGPSDTTDDVVLQESLDAAIVAQDKVVTYEDDGSGGKAYTSDLREALFLRAQRLAARRNSPEGVVGLAGAGGDFVSATLPSYDGDVARLEGPNLKMVVA
jgi:hypothetical protein